MTTHADVAEDARAARTVFVETQIRALDRLESVRFIAPYQTGAAYVEVARGERDAYAVEVAAHPQLSDAALVALQTLGFALTEGVARQSCDGADGVERVAELVVAVLEEPVGIEFDSPLDVHHGSRRAAAELERKLTAIRDRIRPVAERAVGADRVTQDEDGDLTFLFGSTHVWVGARVIAQSEIVVRVFALAAVDVESSPALGLFLAQANFALAIGKFSLDPVRHVVWFEEGLLGESFTDDELRRVIELVCATTDLYDDQITQLFGGRTANEVVVPAIDVSHQKPGRSGYL